jgi:exopolyphosphatase/guanosine-5'-triphosphate,3'-diphosphate pyrophosphatase
VVELGGVRAVEVHKLRRRYSLGGCRAELSKVTVSGAATSTIAVESEDPAQVVATVRSLGLPLERNTCMARGLKALAGGRYAVIDIGTNSVKFTLAERLDGKWSTVVERAEVTRLGERLQKTGRLGKQPIERTADAVAEMAAEATRDGAVEIAAVGTAGLRIAPNRDEFLAAVEERCGLRVEIIDGEEEARLAYVATKAALGLGGESLAVFDTGGGSSQFTFGHGDEVDEQFSVDVGAASFTEQFGLDTAVEEARVAEALDAIGAALSRLDGRPEPDALVGMGGAVTNLAAVKHELESYDPDVVRGTVLDRDEVERQVELYRSRSADERREIVGLQPKRAELILAGACIVLTVLRKLDARRLTVSDRGLRHGLLLERFGGGRL